MKKVSIWVQVYEISLHAVCKGALGEGLGVGKGGKDKIIKLES